MHAQKPHSYGVIPLRKGEFEVEALLIDQRDRLKPGLEYWTFAKGTPEEGETALETAIRETREETGIVCEKVDSDFSYDQHYTFEDEMIQFDKTVTYYIGTSIEYVVAIQAEEVRDSMWLPLSVAREKITHESGKEIIDAIIEHLPNSRLFQGK